MFLKCHSALSLLRCLFSFGEREGAWKHTSELQIRAHDVFLMTTVTKIIFMQEKKIFIALEVRNYPRTQGSLVHDLEKSVGAVLSCKHPDTFLLPWCVLL